VSEEAGRIHFCCWKPLQPGLTYLVQPETPQTGLPSWPWVCCVALTLTDGGWSAHRKRGTVQQSFMLLGVGFCIHNCLKNERRKKEEKRDGELNL